MKEQVDREVTRRQLCEAETPSPSPLTFTTCHKSSQLNTNLFWIVLRNIYFRNIDATRSGYRIARKRLCVRKYTKAFRIQTTTFHNALTSSVTTDIEMYKLLSYFTTNCIFTSLS